MAVLLRLNLIKSLYLYIRYYYAICSCSNHVIVPGSNGYLIMYCWSSETEGSLIGEVDNDCGSRAELAGQSLSVTPRVDNDAISHNYPPGPNKRGTRSQPWTLVLL